MKAKPIQTRYAGHLFRSRLEARWAVLFDAAGIEWEYEVQGYELASGWWYLPDFWLPQVMMWAEVKPTLLNALEFQKCWELAQGTGFEVLLLDGKPEERLYAAISTPSMEPADRNFPTEAAVLNHYDIFDGNHYWKDERRFYWADGGVVELPTATGGVLNNYRSSSGSNCDWEELKWIEKANSARFEHGDAA